MFIEDIQTFKKSLMVTHFQLISHKLKQNQFEAMFIYYIETLMKSLMVSHIYLITLETVVLDDCEQCFASVLIEYNLAKLKKTLKF